MRSGRATARISTLHSHFDLRTINVSAIRRYIKSRRAALRIGSSTHSFAPPSSFPHGQLVVTLTAQEAWTRLLDRARQELPEQTFKTWLEPTEPLRIEGDKLFVGAPDRFAARSEEHTSELQSRLHLVC